MDGGRPDRQRHRHGVDVEQVGGVHEEVRSPAEAGLGERGVDGSGGEDRRDRQALRVEATVGDHEDVRAPLGGRDRLPREPLERGGEPLPPIGGEPPAIEPSHAPAPVDERRKQAVEIRHDRAGETERGSGPRRAAQQRGPSTDLHPQVHHDPLALRVDRRVRDLGERLPQVIGHRPVEPRATGRRRVVAHAPEGLVRLEGHRLDVQPATLGVETGEVAELGRFEGRIVDGALARTVLVGRARVVVDRQVAQDPGFRLGVLEHLAAARIDEQHLTRPEASPADRLGRRQRHGPRLGGDRHQAACRDREGRRAQAVPVDHRADLPAVGEHQRRGSVPRRQEPRRPAAERGHVGMRRASEVERFGDRGEERLREVPAGGREELEPLVERQRIGAVRREQRAGLDQLGRDPLRAAVPGAPPDLLPVAADGVDLAVVGDRPEGLGEAPHGMRVRRVALVEERVADHERFGQVGVQLGEPGARDETLVDHGPARRRRDRQLGEGAARGARCALHAPAGNDEASFEGVVTDRRAGLPHRTRHDRLAERGSRCRGRAPEGGGIGRNGAPAEDRHARLVEDPFDQLATRGPGRTTARQEGEDDRRAGSGRRAGEQLENGPVERQGDPGAVARSAVGAECPAMAERRETRQRQRQHPVA